MSLAVYYRDKQIVACLRSGEPGAWSTNLGVCLAVAGGLSAMYNQGWESCADKAHWGPGW